MPCPCPTGVFGCNHGNKTKIITWTGYVPQLPVWRETSFMLCLLDDILCAIYLETIFTVWQSTFHSPYDSPHSIHHMTVHIPFIIKLGQFPLHSSYGSLHSIHHMAVSTVSTLFIIWWSLPYSSHDCLCFIHHMPVSTLFITCQSPLYSSHDSLHSIHHMPVSALSITWQSPLYSPHASLRSIHHMTVCSIHHNYECSASNKSLFCLSPGELSNTY